MRNEQKQEVLGCIKSLHQAHEEIKASLNQNNTILVQNMLSECQEFAVSLGENIEKLEGEGQSTVSCLEEYCETLYHVYEELDSNRFDSNKVYKILQKQLLKVENSVNNDIHVKKEVVFLPYKASMWDSLESAWKAAEDDPDCDAYVIPIPYYDKNPDGSFGEMHYEADLYPEYVPVVSYVSYDFEKRRPDEIFIHNPYDECNYVTSVMPYFYSKNLKQFTDQLIYIPYFVLGEIKPDDKEALEGMHKFCMVPGVFNADKVIVQSENMRLVYIEVLTKVSGEKSRRYWQKKILGLGSPKIDKVLNTKEEDLEISDEWLKVIRKSNGSRKKIIFYNTSVSALLGRDKQMLDKMQDVFQVFKANQHEVALLWRPHPLMKATIESMRPQLWEAYQQLVRQYREEGWGIYDDSADMSKALVLSDGYYGDPSSVQWLFQKAGKQFVIQDVDWKNYVRYSIAATEAITYVNGEYWYVPYWGNCLYRMKSCTFEGKQEGTFHEKGKRGLFSGIVPYGSKLFFIPKFADFISVYDMREKRMYQLQFQDSDGLAGLRGSRFLSYIVIGDCLYLIPYSYHSLIMIHMDTNMIEQYAIYEDKEDKVISSGNGAVIDGQIYFVNQEESCIMKFDTGKKTIDKIFPGNEKRVYTHLFCVNRKIWLIPYHVEDGIRIWNIQQNKFESFITLPDEIVERPKESEIIKYPKDIAQSLRNSDSAYFSSGVFHGKEIHLLAGFLGKNIIIHTEEKKCESWDVKPECFETIKYTWMWSLKLISYLQVEDELYAISGISGEWYRYKNMIWERVEKQASIVKDGKKVLLMDREPFMNLGRKQLQNTSNIGKEVYLKLKREQKSGRVPD